jgi:hypothetical protein
MGLPASQRRALNQIEKTLAADDHYGLAALFAIFTSLAGHEAMPATERVTAPPWPWRRPGRPWRRMRPGLVTVVGLAMAVGALVALSLLLPGPQVCAQGSVALVAAHAQSVPALRHPACVTQQNKPSETGQNGLYTP